MTAPDASIELMRLVTGAWAARLVHTAVELGIADHLAGAPRGVDFLATQIGAHAPSLARLLRALTAIGVLHESQGRSYSLTPLGDATERCARLYASLGAICPRRRSRDRLGSINPCRSHG